MNIRDLALDIYNRPIDMVCDNIVDVARIYKALQYIQKRCCREDERNKLSKAKQFEEQFTYWTVEDIKETLGRNWKQNVVTLKQFADAVKWRFEKSYSEPIGVQETELTKLFVNHKNISNYLKMSMKIGLFNRLTDYYQYKNESISYEYSFNSNIYDLINDIHNQILKIINSKTINKSNQTNLYIYGGKVCIDDSRLSDVRIGSDLSGVNVNDIPDEMILEALNRKYKQFVDYKVIAERLNEELCDEEKIIFQWNLEKQTRKNVMLKKVGFRACNRMGNYKKRSKAYDSITYKGKYREDYLDSRFGKDNWTEFDFKSSIWQLTYFFNKGEWLNNEVDLYNEIYKKCIDESGFKSKKERDLFKLFGNVEYFDNPKMMGCHTLAKIYELRKWIAEYFEFSAEEANQYDKSMYDAELEQLKYIFKVVHESVVDVVGDLLGSEIFLHESCLYLELFAELKDAGYDVVQVFDGFYFSKSKSKNIKSLIKTKFVDIINNYKSKYNQSIKISNKSIKSNEINLKSKTDTNLYIYGGKVCNKAIDADILEAVERDERLKAIASRIYKAVKDAYDNTLIGSVTAKRLVESLGYEFDVSCFKKTWRANNKELVSKIEKYIKEFKNRQIEG